MKHQFLGNSKDGIATDNNNNNNNNNNNKQFRNLSQFVVVPVVATYVP